MCFAGASRSLCQAAATSPLAVSTPDPCLSATVLAQVFVTEVNSHRDHIIELDKTGTHLKYFSQKQDVVLIKNLLLSVQGRWEKLVQRSVERGRQLDDARKRAKQVRLWLWILFRYLLGKVAAAEIKPGKLGGTNSFCCTVKLFPSFLTTLPLSCWSLRLFLVTRQFHESWNKLMEWLDESERNLDSDVEIANEPDKIKAQLTQHKVIKTLFPQYRVTLVNWVPFVIVRFIRLSDAKFFTCVRSLKDLTVFYCHIYLFIYSLDSEISFLAPFSFCC